MPVSKKSSVLGININSNCLNAVLLAVAFIAGGLCYAIIENVYFHKHSVSLDSFENEVNKASKLQRQNIIDRSNMDTNTNNNNVNSMNDDNNSNNNGNNNNKKQQIFIDLGANCGNSYLKFVQDKKLPDITKFDEAYLWEPHPLLNQVYLDPLAKETNNNDNLPHMTIMPYVGWISDDSNLTFYLHNRKEFDENNPNWIDEWRKKWPCDPKSGRNPFGASTILGDTAHAGKPYSVPSYNVPKWFVDTFPTCVDKSQSNCYIILKIDIEGAEYPMLQNMLYNEPYTACMMDEFYIEFHSASQLIKDKTVLNSYKNDIGTIKEAYDGNQVILPRTNENINSIKKDIANRFEQICNRKINLDGWH